MKRLTVVMDQETEMYLKQIQDYTMLSKKSLIKKVLRDYYEGLIRDGEIDPVDENTVINHNNFDQRKREDYIREWESGLYE